MNLKKILLRFLLFTIILGALFGAAFFTRTGWLPLIKQTLFPGEAGKEAAKQDEHDHPHDDANRIKLSEQAQKNLKLIVDAVTPEKYTRTILIPGMVVDRPGLSDRGVISPVAGVITAVHIQPGDTLKPGEKMFNIRLLSEVFQNTQNELFRSSRDLQITKESLARLRSAGTEAVPQARLIEIENQEKKLAASIIAYRQELQNRGLSKEQMDAIVLGNFVSEITIPVPEVNETERITTVASAVNSTPSLMTAAFEVKEIKTQVGEQVQAGQSLCMLANHRLLYIEGRAFKQESGLLEKAAQNGWKVRAEFAEESNGWPASEDNLEIRHLANTVDAVSRTYAFFLPITNQSRSFDKDGKTFLVWRLRPGQRVRLKVPVDQFEDVFVLPLDAIVREGAEVYVFRQNGNLFERKPVHLLLEDSEAVLIANDGSIGPGQFIARNGAAALNRALKAKAAAGGGHEGHDHAH